MLSSASRARRTVRRHARPSCERLEVRQVLSAALLATPTPPPNTISGRVTNLAGRGVGHVEIDLMNSRNQVVARTRTNASGSYLFHVAKTDAYVVTEVTPKGAVQLMPTFATTPPGGVALPGSYGYGFGINVAAGPVGPLSWIQVAPSEAEPFESAVNVFGPTVDLSRVVAINNLPVAPSETINNGHQIQVQFPANTTADTLTLNGLVYSLAQFHYHDPSETTVNGKRYNMEEHFVYVAPSGAETVVAVLLQLGAHNDALQPILNAATSNLTKSGSTTTSLGTIDFAGLLPHNTQGWYYEGALTTPPDSQPANWFVFKSPITLDANQLAQYEAVALSGGFLPNARNTQPLDGRTLNRIGNDIVFTAGSSVSGANFVLGS